jgi:hypothetical protein
MMINNIYGVMFLKQRDIICFLACMIVILAGSACAAEPLSKSIATEAKSGVVGIGTTLKSADIALSQADAEPSTELNLIKSEVISKSSLSADFANLKRSDKSIALAGDFLVQKGFEAQTKDENFFGLKETYSVKSKTTGEETQETFTLMVQDYRSKSSKDVGAVARVSVVAGNQKQDYTFNLIAPEGNFDKATEYQVAIAQKGPGKLEVVKANSWWSCVKQKIKEKCVGPCITSLTTCSGTWTAYFACVAARCGSCLVKQAACCACDCSWWCKWAVGCCDR